MPAAEVRRVQRVADKCDVGGVAQRVSVGIVDHDFDVAGRCDSTDLTGFVAPDIEQETTHKKLHLYPLGTSDS